MSAADDTTGPAGPAETNEALFERAQRVIPGGVNSPVRAFRSVGGTPYFVVKGQGARVTDVEGTTFYDLVQSYGAVIAGHAHPKVIEAIRAAAGDGTSFGAPTPREVLLAEAICERVPSVQKVRMVNSGTEATMSAIRVARGPPVAPSCSSSPATTTATATACSCPAAPPWHRSASRLRPGSPTVPSPTP